MSSKKRKRSKVSKPAVASTPERGISFLKRHCRGLMLVAILVASVRIAGTYTIFSHTFDEPAHIACGMEWLDKGVYTWEPQHPPLSRVAAALGPYLLGIRSQGTPRLGPIPMIDEGLTILYKDQHYDRTLALARLGTLPFFWVACLIVYLWGKRFYGPEVAAASVLLFTFLPPVLAHAGLATTDMALTAFLGAAFFSGVVCLEQPTYRNGALFGFAGGFAVLSKFSSLAFFPASAALALICHLSLERPKWRDYARSIGRRVPPLGLALLVACLLIWAGYRFSYGRVGFANLSLPAPELYQGIQDVIKHNQGGHPSYLLGQRSQYGFWYFYPVMLAVKTPLAFVFLLGLGIVFACRKQDNSRRGWLPLAYVGGILAVAFFSRINIGIRHILPVYTGFSLLAGVGCVRLLEPRPKRLLQRCALPLSIAWFAGASLLAHPDYLPYFNELGGSEPEKIAVDSDLDWGQDVKRLAMRLQQAHAQEVSFTPYAPFDVRDEQNFPRLFLSNALQPSPGWNAVSVSVWKQARLGLRDSNPQIKTLWPDITPPQERIGKGILLWNFGSPPQRR
jgi:hypothetical protein